jgi:hypothetical protein
LIEHAFVVDPRNQTIENRQLVFEQAAHSVNRGSAGKIAGPAR